MLGDVIIKYNIANSPTDPPSVVFMGILVKVVDPFKGEGSFLVCSSFGRGHSNSSTPVQTVGQANGKGMKECARKVVGFASRRDIGSVWHLL